MITFFLALKISHFAWKSNFNIHLCSEMYASLYKRFQIFINLCNQTSAENIVDQENCPTYLKRDFISI